MMTKTSVTRNRSASEEERESETERLMVEAAKGRAIG